MTKILVLTPIPIKNVKTLYMSTAFPLTFSPLLPIYRVVVELNLVVKW